MREVTFSVQVTERLIRTYRVRLIPGEALSDEDLLEAVQSGDAEFLDEEYDRTVEDPEVIEREESGEDDPR